MGNRDRQQVSGELRNNCYDNPQKECRSPWRRCKVENVRRFRQVAEKGAIRSLKELALLGVSKNAR